MNSMTKNVMVSRIHATMAQLERMEDVVAREAPLHIFLGAIHFVSILCSPNLLKEFVVGYLLGEDLIRAINEIASINFDDENRCYVTLRGVNTEKQAIVSKPFTRLIVSACGSDGSRSLSELLDTIELKPLPSWQIKARMIALSVKQLNVLANTYRKTGGVHVAAVFNSDGRMVVLTEDVGRHNAVDKAIGAASLGKQDLSECFLVLSGRLSGDIVLKAARVQIPIMASLAAAVDSGLEVAEKTGVTLVGFVRGYRMNVYTFPERIKL